MRRGTCISSGMPNVFAPSQSCRGKCFTALAACGFNQSLSCADNEQRRHSCSDLDGCGSQRSESLQISEGKRTFLVLPLALVHEVFDEPGVEICIAQMRVTSLQVDLELEDSALDSQKGHIESTSTEIEDEDVPLATETTLLIEAVCDGGGGRLVDDTKHVDTSDDTGILGSLTASF